ncbi:UNVERIFIED_CONTAM: hypothetical protein PYX00_004501 [Menopon gallinae]|uniref:TGF-beta propeptide domain-containing protein n=1 Tax=Menopon gallinae TaxID=328185 RepID=A0AAW2I5P8_9NEOP
MHRKALWLLPLAWFVSSIVIPTETRYIDTAVAEKNETEEDDTDLEQVLADYYDNLMEIWGQDLETENEEEKEVEEEEKTKPRRHGGKIRTSSEPDSKELLKNSTKDYYDLAVPIQIGNITYRYLNQSYAALLSMQRANRERETSEDASVGRIKNIRLTSIKDSLLNLRGGNSSVNRLYPSPQQTKTLKELFEKRLKESPDWSTSNMYAEKRQSFYPSCDIPRNTDEDIWADQHTMNLFFDVYFPTPRSDSTLMIVNAVLRLYTKSQVNVTVPDLMIQMDQTSVHIPNYSLLNADDDERIRISVYWYTKSLRRHRSTQMMPLYGNNLLTFDIRAAVRSWKESGKNFGLLVTVEDENSNPLEPTKYIYPMNCSKWAGTVISAEI